MEARAATRSLIGRRRRPCVAAADDADDDSGESDEDKDAAAADASPSRQARTAPLASPAPALALASLAHGLHQKRHSSMASSESAAALENCLRLRRAAARLLRTRARASRVFLLSSSTSSFFL